MFRFCFTHKFVLHCKYCIHPFIIFSLFQTFGTTTFLTFTQASLSLEYSCFSVSFLFYVVVSEHITTTVDAMVSLMLNILEWPVCVLCQWALPSACPECSASRGTSWSNHGWVKGPAPSPLVTTFCCSKRWLWRVFKVLFLIFPAVVWGRGRHAELHNVWRRLAIQETQW